MNKPKENIAVAIVVLLALAACQRESTSQWQGYVEAEFVDVASAQSGRLEQLAVQRGQTVAAQAPLFRLEAEREQAEFRQAQQQLAAASAQLEDLKTGKRPPELAVIRAQLAQARADQRLRDEQLHRDQAQFAVAAIAQAQLDASRAAADSAGARVRELSSQIEVATLPGREQQLAAQTAQVDAMQAQLAQAQWVLQQKSVQSMQAGLIDDTLYRVGEWVAAGSPVIRLLPPENIKVRFFVPAAALPRLQPGSEVRLHCEACGDDMAAQIRYIAPQAEFTPPVIYSNETRDKLVFMVEARPSAADAQRLHPGQPMQVRLP